MISRNSLPVLIEVDGGVTLDNIGSIVNAGADICVAGSSVFGSSDYGKTIAAMKAIIK